MNEIKRAFANFFSSQPAAPKALEQHGLDNDGPIVRNKPAETGRLVAPKPLVSGPSSQDAPRAAATQPGYMEKPQRPAPERAGPANAATRSSSSQVGQPPASTSSPRSDTSVFFNAVKTGNLATVRKCIEQGVDLSHLTPKPEAPAVAVALMSNNLQMIKLLLPISSHEDKLEALALAAGTPPARRSGLKPGIATILDSVNRENRPGPEWEKKQEEIDFMSKFLNQWK
jgi:hypothetical protein